PYAQGEGTRWMSAFAGGAVERIVDENPHSQPSPPQGGKGLNPVHQIGETLEDVEGICRSGGGFGVVLYAEDRFAG
ncbi:MAG: hypothetical protein RLZZ141_2318, partial [Pseudomonadota bacterium]